MIFLSSPLADGKVKIAFAARNSFDWTDTKVGDFLKVRKSRAVESKIIDFVQSMLANSRSLKLISDIANCIEFKFYPK